MLLISFFLCKALFYLCAAILWGIIIYFVCCHIESYDCFLNSNDYEAKNLHDQRFNSYAFFSRWKRLVVMIVWSKQFYLQSCKYQTKILNTVWNSCFKYILQSSTCLVGRILYLVATTLAQRLYDLLETVKSIILFCCYCKESCVREGCFKASRKQKVSYLAGCL